MPEFLEDYPNEMGQVYAEFFQYLYLCCYDFKENMTLHNILKTAERVHMRNLVAFFHDNKKYQDDLIYKDILSLPANLQIIISEDLRLFLNKSTAHLSKKRGKQKFPEEEYLNTKKELIKAINSFVKEIDNGNVKNEYQTQLQDQTVKNVGKEIHLLITKIIVINAVGGIEITL